eukprot:scaffold8126_cov170-Amphora_coffeaeformis.AAC.8
MAAAQNVSDGAESVEATSSSAATTSNGTDSVKAAPSKKSLEERSKIPNSFYVTVVGYLAIAYFGNVFRMETLYSWMDSMLLSTDKVYGSLVYSQELAQSLVKGESRPLSEYVQVSFITLSVLSLLYIFVWAPFRAGFWTGSRSRRHVFHRYMGLAYMAQYFLAWFEFSTNYEESGKDSFLPMFIALNGIIQGWSAFFSFKVLPELTDAGYYSNKAVLSRSFVHENVFYSFMCLMGAVYYNDNCRAALKAAGWPARIFELVYMFGPYVVIRPMFPTTRFSNAGTTRNGRTADAETFYKYATIAVKIFYLYGKYFLGFYMNFLLFLDLVEPGPTRKFMDGLLLLNIGTVSLAIFLHTLRFRKIYATFSALPLAYELFGAHLRLCGVCGAGLLANMTRRKDVQVAWTVCTMVLLCWPGIEW